jgi:hypothetical protein
MVDDHGQHPESVKSGTAAFLTWVVTANLFTRPRYSCKLVTDQPLILLGSTSRSHGEGAGSASDLLLSTGGPLIVQGLETGGRSCEASDAVG